MPRNASIAFPSQFEKLFSRLLIELNTPSISPSAIHSKVQHSQSHPAGTIARCFSLENPEEPSGTSLLM